MDIYKAIQELVAERNRLDRVIQSLEGGMSGRAGAAPKKRGRKSMSAAERAEVSARMRKLWEERRRQKLQVSAELRERAGQESVSS